ncbi:MAG: type II toxin-antitoxin system RelE/ParE family toxin [Anaerolineae bacterium]
MASYRIEWKRSAAKELKRLPSDVIQRVLQAVEGLASNAVPSGAVRLRGTEHTFRLRVGDYRIVYIVEQAILRIEIVRVRHRSEVYR